MISLVSSPARLCDGHSRREWLRVGGSSALGLSLPALIGARAGAAPSGGELNFGRAKHCILVFLLGGPPQQETWDPKPEAPVEVRGPFGLIDTRTPGLRVCELMPMTAGLTDKIAVMRAMSTFDSAHSSSGYWMLTGRPHAPTNSENAPAGPPNDWPCVPAIVRHVRGDAGGLPAAVRLPEDIWNTGGIRWPGQDGGLLGRAADPWLLNCHPHKPDFSIPELALSPDVSPLRVDARRSLLSQLEGRLAKAERSGAAARWDGTMQQAFDLVNSPRGRAAFTLEGEPTAVRERYGMNRFGQSLLMARRMVEAGVSIVQVNWTRWEHDTAVNPAWDTHAKNAERLKDDLMPPMDRGYSALLEDLAQRGLLEETLVVWMGEFGRTPRINPSGGRDHWGPVYSVALAGGGVRGGVVYGSSDAIAAYPRDGRRQPQDLAATIFHLLGIPPHTEMHDTLGRPFPVSAGEIIRPIL